MNVATMLAELSEGWHVYLITVTDHGWDLTLRSRKDDHSFRFHGADLGRVVRAAWAGEPQGLVP
jgi:hypothetical protein